MKIPAFTVTDTRFLRHNGNDANTSELQPSLPPPTLLGFRSDLPESSQKAAMQVHRRHLHQEWSLEHQVAIKAKSQGTLVSILQADAQRQHTPKELVDEDQQLRRCQQQALALAFLITEAHQCARKKHKRRNVTMVTAEERRAAHNRHAKDEVDSSEEEDDAPSAETTPGRKTKKKKPSVDIGDPRMVKLLLSDINLLLQSQQEPQSSSTTKAADIPQYVRAQLADLNMWH